MPDMVVVFVAAPDNCVWAICSGGRPLRASPGDWSWSSALPSDADLSVRSIAFTTRCGGVVAHGGCHLVTYVAAGC
jgi:hypothetical protein